MTIPSEPKCWILLMLVSLVSNLAIGSPENYSEILNQINGTLNSIEGKLDAEKTKLEQLEHLESMAIQLLPLLERNFKICLSDSFSETPKCNLGDFNCTEINLLDQTANCVMCVNGTLIPDTDNGPPDYCAHVVTIQKTNIEIKFEADKVTFTHGGTVLGSILLNSRQSVEDNPDCLCPWTLFNYTNFKNNPLKISKLNDLLHCTDKCAGMGWLCLANGKADKVGKCYNPIATCNIQDGVTPTCSVKKLPKINVNVKHDCTADNLTSDGAIDKCVFTWKLEPKEFLVHGSKISFEIEWNDEKIQDLQCSGSYKWTCSNTSCSNNTVYHYNFTTCQFVSNNSSKTELEDSSTQPPEPDGGDSGVGAATWLVVIIVIILIVFLSYVAYQNYEKINSCINGTESRGRPPPTSRGRGRGRIKGKYGPIPMDEVVTHHDE